MQLQNFKKFNILSHLPLCANWISWVIVLYFLFFPGGRIFSLSKDNLVCLLSLMNFISVFLLFLRVHNSKKCFSASTLTNNKRKLVENEWCSQRVFKLFLRISYVNLLICIVIVIAGWNFVLARIGPRSGDPR